MTDRDYDSFLGEFRRLSAALERYKQSPAEANAKADAYFHVLKQFPLELVIAKADAWLCKETKMPKPAEWAGQIVRPKIPELPVMRDEDARVWLRAEQLRWEDRPCSCRLCTEARVTELPIRFAPQFDRDDREVRMRLGDRIVTAGAWIHGDDLLRWHLAWERFFTDARAFAKKTGANLEAVLQ